MALAPIPVTFSRMTKDPLERGVYHATLADAQTYANSATAIIGQIIIVTTDPPQIYQIQTNKSLLLLKHDSGSGSLDQEIVSTVDVGGIKKGDIVSVGTLYTELFKKLLTPEIYPSVTSFTSTPIPFGLLEVGQSLTNLTLNATIAKGTNNIQSAKIVRLPSTVLVENTSMATGGTLTTSGYAGINTGVRQYELVVTDVEGLTTTVDASFEFVYPALFGIVNSQTPTTAQLLALPHTLVKKNNIKNSYTPNGQYMAAAFPVSWGTPLEITDSSNFDLLPLFNHTTPTLTFASYNQQYNLYIYKTAASVIDYKINFIFNPPTT